MKKYVYGSALLGLFCIGICNADDSTRAPGYRYDRKGTAVSSKGSTIFTNLRVNIKDDTKKLHLVSTNNDPNVITKTYILKNADPYEIRPYLLSAVKAQRIDTSSTTVECIKFNDGTGALIVSAEDYRFDKMDGAMGFDEMIGILDKTKISSAPGTETYIYFPKYWDANSLASIVRNVGLNYAGDGVELKGGADRVVVDSGLNAIVFYTPAYNKKTIEEMLKLYDTPTSEVKILYTIYELDTENDGKIGVDYQSWKNGPGADLFSTAGRFSKGWSGGAMDGVVDGTGWNNTQFVKFSPRWNTRYLDFLVAKSKAKVITSGEMSIMNNTPGVVSSLTSVPRFDNSNKIPDMEVKSDYFTLENQNFRENGTGAAVGNLGDYQISATDKTGKPIYVSDFTGSMTFTRLKYQNSVTTYEMKIVSGNGTIYKDGRESYSTKVVCYNLAVAQCTLARVVVGVNPLTGAPIYDDTYSWTPLDSWRMDKQMMVMKGYSTETAGQEYGFEMHITPIVNACATMLNITMNNSSLIGFAGDGSPRLDLSTVDTQVMLSNEGQKFVIGGIDKKTIVRSVSKVPWLGDIPIIGYALSSESESTKKSQMVAVLECKLIDPDTKLPDGIVGEMKLVDDKTEKNGEINDFKNCNYGFDQFILDKDKKSLDPLP